MNSFSLLSEESAQSTPLGPSRLGAYARELARAQAVGHRRRGGSALLARLQSNQVRLREVYQAITARVRSGEDITPAGEWLLDNAYIVEEQIRDIRTYLPLGYYRKLPKLTNSELAGSPRVVGLVWEYLAHSENNFDPESLRSFVRAYQEVQPLTIGELWAVAISLRLVLVESLRRLSDWVLAWHKTRDAADAFADGVLGGQNAKSRSLERELSNSPLPDTFRLQLIQRLRQGGQAPIPTFEQVLGDLQRQSLSPDDLVSLEHQRQAEANGLVRNAITSLRNIEMFDWAGFVEGVSLVDVELRQSSTYTQADFPTRDRYRKAIEALAEGSPHSELEVAKIVMERAKAAPPEVPRQADPGYYLVDVGRRPLEKSLGYRIPLSRWAMRAFVDHAVPGYIGTVLFLTLLVLAVPLLMNFHPEAGWPFWIMGLVALIPASDLGIALLNLYVTSTVPPRLLPKLELKGGVPSELRTAVVVPTLLTNAEGIAEQLEQLESHYLSNPDGDVRFALLSDWADAPQAGMPQDTALLEAAKKGVLLLRSRYGPLPDGAPRFLLFHRERRYNAGEGAWIGWERKRGKLHEFNRLLRGAEDTSFVKLPEVSEVPQDVRYVITLDSDTQMPYGGVARMVGALAHPLNRPVLDAQTREVRQGYGLLQPKVTPALPPRGQDSLYRMAFSGPAGIDPYAAAASDVYQDLYGEGTYVGKGIYDLDAFETALEHRVPENAVLSHDLFEGIFARAALATDLEFVEEYPRQYEVHAARQHRWTRGDWQLLPWLFSRREAIDAVSRFKMWDNLRRSLSAPSTLLTLIAAWLIPGASPLVWTGFVLVKFALPILLPALAGAFPPRRGISWRSHLRRVRTDAELALLNVGLSLTFLAHQAGVMLDAIGLALGRLRSHKRLLEWQTAAQVSSGVSLEPRQVYKRMMAAPIIAVGIGVLVLVFRTENFIWALPLLLLWGLSPTVARLTSLPLMPTQQIPLVPRQVQLLRQVARRTWQFFERFVTAQENHLPPDNFQEDPAPKIAHRTSPTNIGLYLLSTLGAQDFGWIGRAETLERLNATVDTIERMEKFRGHLFNWYDTRSLAVLEPRYVSTVDSGNLAGDLLAAKEGALELCSSPLRRSTAGLQDTFFLLQTSVARVNLRDSSLVSAKQFNETLKVVDGQLARAVSPADWAGYLGELEAEAGSLLDMVEALRAEGFVAERGEPVVWAEALLNGIRSHRRDIAGLPAEAAWLELVARLERLFEDMGFGFLYHADQKLFSIGYDAHSQRLDGGSYDLLASEARLASFLAVARGEIPAEHWFRLGRTLTPVERGSALVSWSGSMFEYLMPDLLLQPPPGSLLENTARQVVDRQISYGRERGVPWGVSESAYNARDLDGNYQYSAFGLPGLGLKRGLAEDLVIAPYASVLGATVDPAEAATNLGRLTELKAYSDFGFYDALDYSKDRLPEGQDFALVKNVMAHHQGMSLVALTNVLRDRSIQRRFHADPRVRAAELLLQERTPRGVIVVRPRSEEVEAGVHVREMAPPALRRFTQVGGYPQTHLLSNGRFSVMLSASGGGYTRWNELALTRWGADSAKDAQGSFLFLRDLGTGRVWSATQNPLKGLGQNYEVEFSEEQARFFHQEGEVFSTLRAIVTGGDGELRRLTLSNRGETAVELEVTTYAEPVLATPQADSAHPAFSKLFLETEFVGGLEALLASRRPRSLEEPRLWMGQVLGVEGSVGGLQFETDRARFLGRGRDLGGAVALQDGRPLSGTVGPVLDPIFALRRRVRLEPGGLARLCLATVAGDSREGVLEALDRYRDPAAFEGQYEQAWTRTQVELRHLGIEAEEAGYAQELAGYLLYPSPALRTPAETLRANTLGQPELWKHGISGDLPIALLEVEQIDDKDIVRQLLRAFQYLRRKRLAFDLVILSNQAPSYTQELQASLENLIRLAQSGQAQEDHPVRGQVYVLRSDILSQSDKDLLRSVARVVLSSHNGSLAEQLRRVRPSPTLTSNVPSPSRPAPIPRATPTDPMPRQRGLRFDNGLGGFSEDGREYVITLGEGQWTPAPWTNVVANPDFGFLVTESGSGFTWGGNSREFKLTPWSNDPISDPPGEVFYIQDRETGELWNPTPLPIRENTPYVIRHGHGYSSFEHRSHGITSELLQFVPLQDPVKISRLRLENPSNKPRRLCVTAYAEWVLGVSRETAPYLVQERETSSNALLARNPWNPEFAEKVAFADLKGQQTACGGGRNGFLGAGGSLARPIALTGGAKLSGKVEPGGDPCAILQREINLAPGETAEVVFLLGVGENREAALKLINAYRGADLEALLAEVRRFWDDTLGAVQVQTPDPSLDLLTNRWLLYQTLACRVWGRSGFYQSGGAFGFRDQLQDVMALALTQPALVREQILRASAHQFPEGDVQHWWHPPSGRGVRTHISDDRLWLPYALTHYLEATGDTGILDEQVPFIEGPPVPEGQEDSYFQPQVSSQTASVYEHAARALERSLGTGPHGLPLIGSGDWNDGMNRVGRLGKGESVWLAWFLHTNLWEWAKIAERRGERERAKLWRRQVRALKRAIEKSAWDGDWYRRAYFDDGTPLGSAENRECRIDAIAQSWGVITGAAEPDRAARAMAAVDEYLVRRGDGIVLLFTPAFDRSELDPGYIRGYLPGVRENGGQYTHAAIWSAIAFAGLGQGDKAGELFSILNPINQTSSRAGVYRYKVEPYVMAADVYSVPSQLGRGGWTWYTGSAGWMYRAALESLLGFRVRRGRLFVDPCIPRAWPGYRMQFKYHSARYQVQVENPGGHSRGVAALELDGEALNPLGGLPLQDDGKVHQVRVQLGANPSRSPEPNSESSA